MGGLLKRDGARDIFISPVSRETIFNNVLFTPEIRESENKEREKERRKQASYRRK